MLLYPTPIGYSGGSPSEGARVLVSLVLLAMVAAWLGSRGTELSADGQRYRKYFGLLGWRFGRWQLLPPVVGITLKLFSTRGGGPAPSSTSWGVWDTSGARRQQLVLLLSLQNSTTGLVIGEFAADELPQARQAAQELAQRFSVPTHEYLVPQRTQRR